MVRLVGGCGGIGRVRDGLVRDVGNGVRTRHLAGPGGPVGAHHARDAVPAEAGVEVLVRHRRSVDCLAHTGAGREGSVLPEGHVIHRLARTLTAEFGGRPVQVASPQGRFAEAAALLDGTVLCGAEAVGKHLFVSFEGDRVVWIHLGLIGKLQFGPSSELASPETLRLRIAANGVRADLRGPQWCRLITTAEKDAVAASSGPDPLRPDADPERAWARIHRSGRPIGALLMDQAIAAGVGNIYRAEVLFRHRIDPWLPGRELGRATFDSVWSDLVELMPLGVRDGRIDTVEDDHTPEAMGRPPRVDRHGGEVYVYRRAGDPCHVCGTEVARADFHGRTLYWCPTCQPSGSAGTPR